MNVVVVNPASRGKVYGQLASLAAIEMPVWPGIIAEFLVRKGYQVELLDAEVEGWSAQETAAQIQRRDPALAVFPVYGQQPSASTQTLPAAEAVAKLAGVRSICLGTHPSALPERTLREGPWNYVAQGEGPYTILGLLHVLEGMGSWGEVPGLWYRHGDRIERPTPPRLIEDLDAEIGDRGFEWFDFRRYRAHNWHAWGFDGRSPYASLQTSLGCPFRCTFCCINAPFESEGGGRRAEGGGKPLIPHPSSLIPRRQAYRRWSVANVLGAFRQLAERGVVHVKIPDEMFLLDRRHVEGICDGLIGEGLTHFNIWAYARIDTVKDTALLAKLKRAGFNWLGLGIESGSKHVRDGVEKGRFGNAETIEACRRVRDAGIHIGANYIFGLPDDDMASMHATYDLACEVNAELANFYCAMAYPGSALYARAMANGEWRMADGPGGPGWIGYSQHSYYCTPLPTEHLRAETVLDFRDRMFHDYYARAEHRALIERAFGPKVVDEIKAMNAMRIARQHWLEGAHDAAPNAVAALA